MKYFSKPAAAIFQLHLYYVAIKVGNNDGIIDLVNNLDFFRDNTGANGFLELVHTFMIRESWCCTRYFILDQGFSATRAPASLMTRKLL